MRLGPEVGSGMITVRISPDMEMAVVGTPEHFRRYGFPQTPADFGRPPASLISSATVAFTPGNNVDGKKITHPPQGQWAFAGSYMEAKAAGSVWGWPMSRKS